MILVPLPRRVGPTAAPLFSPRRTWRRRTLPRDRSCRGRADPPRVVAGADRVGRTVAIAESADGTFGTGDNAVAGRATERRCAAPRVRRSVPRAHRPTDARDHQAACEDGRSIRVPPIADR